MKKIISFILAGILAASTYCVSAKVSQDNPTRNYNDIKITIDGSAVATNDTTEPFIIDGTTYLPVRALAEALGLNVEWDGANNTVKLTSKGYQQPTTTTTTANLTVEQTNAIKKAESYLKIMSFSRSGLIKQLEFEKFSTEAATFAVDYLNINWYEQAVKKAESYLKIMSFSKDGLIDQLEFEGFTEDEAKYGADKAYN